MRAFVVALQFLTRLPLVRVSAADAGLRGRSVVYYPPVGLLIGLLLVAVGALLADTEALLAAVLVLLAWALVTGGLHLDGLADSADAWAGGHGDRERSLAIMKDPASGPLGVTAVVLVLLVKFAALTVLLRHQQWTLLWVAPLLGRSALVLLFLTTPYVRPEGIGGAQALHLPRAAASAVLAATAIALPLAAGTPGAVSLVAAIVALWALRQLMMTRLGGTTGDTLGASCEIVEAVVLVVMALASAPVAIRAAGG